MNAEPQGTDRCKKKRSEEAKKWHGGGLCAQRTGYIYIYIYIKNIKKGKSEREREREREIEREREKYMIQKAF